MIKLYNKLNFLELKNALTNGQYSVKKLESFDEVSGLRIGKLIMVFKDNRPTLHIMTDSSEYVDGWRKSIAGKIGRDAKKNEVFRYSIIAYESKVNKSIMKALVREFSEFQAEIPQAELESLAQMIESSNCLDIELDGHWFSIIKIISVNENWNSEQRVNYLPIISLEDLGSDYTMVDNTEETYENPLF